ncbi:hypothetical protein CCACVL1_22876 [Corchorus capsularis]|uniref:Uncharacterized protein n=1 Tax=Corchorus capsularis TaxID=210143 RepID=A0A1R3GWH6_COCAP|nr:hypothetical protein CCACVL1_22876 [Corchorus capsularis]
MTVDGGGGRQAKAKRLPISF